MLAGPKGREVGESGELDKAKKNGEGERWMSSACILAVISTRGPDPEPAEYTPSRFQDSQETDKGVAGEAGARSTRLADGEGDGVGAVVVVEHLPRLRDRVRIGGDGRSPELLAPHLRITRGSQGGGHKGV
eukprot:1184200-Prorocentrum_minimum.AAC.6